MNKTLEERIDEQDCWTFRECLGLAADFGTKTRFVILKVMAQGKQYIDSEPATAQQESPSDPQ